jgi:hypothetical protein
MGLRGAFVGPPPGKFMLKTARRAKKFAGVTSLPQYQAATKYLSQTSILHADPCTEHAKKHLIPA